MIRVHFTEPTTTEWQQWVRSCREEQQRLNSSVLHGDRRTIRRRLYKAKDYGFRHEMYLSKSGPFHGKCAYCEEEIYGNQHVDMEHYRPHGSVRTLDWEKVRVRIDDAEQDHPGYYWLAYDWRNLLSACVLCNQKSTEHSEGRLIGKVDRFPVDGSYAVRPGEEESEAPLLINPVHEDPAESLELNRVTLEFRAKDARAGACIDVFGLNDRDLPDRRASVYKQVRQMIGGVLSALNQMVAIDVQPIVDELVRIKAGFGPHTAAARLAISDAFAESASLQVLVATAEAEA